jgi:alkylation response protein AidB-like acyl-CoA dehydrogenase
LRDWLEANLTDDLKVEDAQDQRVSPDRETLERRRAWQKKMHAAGWVGLSWPQEYGGRGANFMQQVIFDEEYFRARAPILPGTVGMSLLGPTLIHCATEEQKKRYLPQILSCDEIWCQGYSEPGAGSDLASLRTRAIDKGDHFLVNGQKVWTSGAQYSDYGEIVCRTNPEAEKHKGITAFIVDMKAPGVTIKPLKQMNGGASFNEVFFDNVRVPHENVLGDVNEGWTVAITTLMNERVAIGSGGGGGGRGTVQHVIDLAQQRGVNGDARVRQQLADLYSKTRIQKFLSMRTLTAATKGKVPGPEGSIGKLLGGRIMTQLGELTVSLAGADAVAGNTRLSQTLLAAPAGHIAGGSDEVMKNIIGERVLGLPGEPRPDKGVAWREVPR